MPQVTLRNTHNLEALISGNWELSFAPTDSRYCRRIFCPMGRSSCFMGYRRRARRRVPRTRLKRS